MKNNNFWFTLFLSITMSISFNATAAEKSTEQTVIQPGGFVHSVYFWLKKPTSEVDRKAFEKHLTAFIDNSQYVKSKLIGTAAPSKRDVVDSSYTYALIVTFSSKEDQDKYQTEDVHLKFVKDAQHLWEKVVVYDAFNTL